MKKIFSSILMLAMSISMFAINYTGKVTITLYDGTYYPNLIVGESSDSEFAGGVLVNGYYAPVQDLASSPLAIYALYGGVEYENLILNSLVNMPIGIKTNSSSSYTFYFAGLQGTVSIYDKVADELIDCTSPYPFTIEEAQKNGYINDRFYLNYNAAAFTYSLTTNEYGWASYSNEVEDVVATVPTGLKIYKGALASDVLNLAEVDYIPMSEGVIVFGAPNTKYYFAAGSGSSSFADNDLKPSSLWSYDPNDVIYCLRGDALYHYTGVDMPANKAYLNLGSGAPAPKRISFHFEETQAIENVEFAAPAEKFIENGEVLIRRGEAVYNLQGQMVR